MSDPLPRVLPDCQGLMQCVLINIVRSRRGAPLRNSKLVAEIINSLPGQVETILLGNDEDFYSECLDLCNTRRIYYLAVPGSASISAWAQDPFLVLGEGNKWGLLAPRAFARADDVQIPHVLAAYLGWQCRNSTLAFEGGNIVVDEDNIFVGADTIYRNAESLQITDNAVISQLEKETGRRVIVIGPYPQPVGHLDAILTPLGGNVLVLADPNWGAALADQSMREFPAMVKTIEREYENAFFSDGEARHRMDDGSEIFPPRVVGRTLEAISDSRALAPTIDRLADVLGRNGFEIKRVPFLYRAASPYKPASSSWDLPSSQDVNHQYSATDPRHGAQYPCLSYNNVLLDVSSENQSVYIPQYHWPALDNAAKSAWLSMGYLAKFTGGFATASMFGGQLRCMVKVLKRFV